MKTCEILWLIVKNFIVKSLFLHSDWEWHDYFPWPEIDFVAFHSNANGDRLILELLMSLFCLQSLVRFKLSKKKHESQYVQDLSVKTCIHCYFKKKSLSKNCFFFLEDYTAYSPYCLCLNLSGTGNLYLAYF